MTDRKLTPIRTEKSFRKRLSKKTPAMQESILQAVDQLRRDPHHPGLRTHRIKSQDGVWGARLNKGNRLTFCWDGDTIVLLNHCNHEQAYSR